MVHDLGYVAVLMCRCTICPSSRQMSWLLVLDVAQHMLATGSDVVQEEWLTCSYGGGGAAAMRQRLQQHKPAPFAGSAAE